MKKLKTEDDKDDNLISKSILSLYTALLRRAIIDLKHENKVIKRNARNWLFNRKNDVNSSLISLIEVCDVLEIDIEKLRKTLEENLESVVEKANCLNNSYRNLKNNKNELKEI